MLKFVCVLVSLWSIFINKGAKANIIMASSSPCLESASGSSQSRDIEMAQAAWAKAKELILDEANHMVLLDEINIAIRYDYVSAAEVVAFLRDHKPEMTHVVLTGRNAHEDLIELADLVTEMELVKHPFRSGIKAQIGVEF